MQGSSDIDIENIFWHLEESDKWNTTSKIFKHIIPLWWSFESVFLPTQQKSHISSESLLKSMLCHLVIFNIFQGKMFTQMQYSMTFIIIVLYQNYTFTFYLETLKKKSRSKKTIIGSDDEFQKLLNVANLKINPPPLASCKCYLQNLNKIVWWPSR